VILAALLAATALAGCKTAGPNFAPPAPPQTPGYLMNGDAPPAGVVSLAPGDHATGPWWKSFGSADLDQVMDQALAGNQTVAAANATLERMRQLAVAQHGQQLPQVDLNGALTGERINIASLGFSGFPNPTLGLYSIGGSVSYDTDLFGGLRRATESSRAQAENAGHEADAAYLTLTGQVTMTALQIATLRAQIAADQEAVDDDKSVIELVRRAEAAGGEPSSATVGGQAQLASDEALLPPLQGQLAQARHALALLVGQAPADWAPPQFVLADFTAPAQVPVSVPSSLVRRRPDILAAEANLHFATAQLGVASAALYPDVRLTANITQTAIPPANLITYGASGWTLASGLTAPIFHGGTLRANKRAAQAGVQMAFAQYRQTVLTAFTQVADVMESITEDDAEIAALEHAERAALAAVRDDENAYKLGGGPLLPVLDDQRKLSMARRQLAMAHGKRLADLAQLYVATAADWREPR
jgi:NodT family efflux transporter outer membrane factor (OMF) lipoprotein